MTPEEKLRKAIKLAEEERNMEIESKPITYTFTCKKVEIDKPPLGVKPFWLGIEERQEELWAAIKRSEHYPEELIDEGEFLERMKRQWQDESI